MNTKEIWTTVECMRCGTDFEHDANFEDAYCPSCGMMIDITM